MTPTRRLHPSRWPVLALLVAAACAPIGRVPSPGGSPGPVPGRSPVGRVRVDGPTVLVNQQPVSGTIALYLGDDVRTDGTGRATIFFDAGGSLALGPDTDPLLEVVNEAGCVGTALLQVVIRTGTFDFFNVTRVCFCDPQDVFCGVPKSDFRVVITGNGANITVSRGKLQVTVGRKAQRHEYRIMQGQFMVVQKGRTSGPQEIVR